MFLPATHTKILTRLRLCLLLAVLLAVGGGCDLASDDPNCEIEETGATTTPAATVPSPTVEQAAAFGGDAARLGDVDGDGVGDVAVAAHGESIGGTDNAGRVYVLDGTDGSVLHTLEPAAVEPYGLFGSSVAAMGDVNGDGAGDVLVGMPDETSVNDTTEVDRAYVFGGAEGRRLHTISSPTPSNHSGFGTAVAGPGDVNGDATPDLAVAEGRRVHLFSGANGEHLRSLTSPNETSFIGSTVAGIGDVNGDGAGDVLVSAMDETVDGAPGAGQVYLFSGADGRLLHTLASPNPNRNGDFGMSAASVGDVDGDGTPDVLVGAGGEIVDGTGGAGRAYLFRGATGTHLRTFTSPNGQERGNFGRAVASVGGVDGDAVPDIAVGAEGESVKGAGCGPAGRVYLFGGTDGSLMQTFESPNAESPGNFGRGLAGTRGPEGGGPSRLLVGAPSETVDGVGSAGRAYLFSIRAD